MTADIRSGEVPRGERAVTIGTGAALAALGLERGLRKHSALGFSLALAGGALVYRGIAARRSWRDSRAHLRHIVSGRPVRIEQHITVARPPAEVYAFWRDLENLPHFMSHLAWVRPLDQRRSRWAARGPAGLNLEWEAAITSDRPGRLIAWHSEPGAWLETWGAIRFQRKRGDRGTKVHLSMYYLLPGGPLGTALARLLGQQPEEQVTEGLQHLKEVLESV